MSWTFPDSMFTNNTATNTQIYRTGSAITNFGSIPINGHELNTVTPTRSTTDLSLSRSHHNYTQQPYQQAYGVSRPTQDYPQTFGSTPDRAQVQQQYLSPLHAQREPSATAYMPPRLVFGSIAPTTNQQTFPTQATPNGTHAASQGSVAGTDDPSLLEKLQEAARPKPSGKSRTSRSKKENRDDDAPTKKPKGQGSKSGSQNRRGGGGSDDEIAKLGLKDRQAAELKMPGKSDEKKEVEAKAPVGLSDEDKLTVVRWITQEERWKDWKLKQHGYWITLSNDVLKPPGRISASQIKNYFTNQAWEKYKAVRERQAHTGGGDGDAKRVDALSSSNDEDSDSDQEEPTETGKRKRKGREKFSQTVLDEFEKSEIFKLIDAVANKDITVIRPRDYNSHTPISDDETPMKKRRLQRSASKDSDSLDSPSHGQYLKQAVEAISKKARTVELVKKEKLKLAQEKERREAAEQAERQELAKRKLALEERESHGREWERALQMIEHANAQVRAAGERLLAKLSAVGDV
ncbi:hypothetical protein B0H34DRAFT_797120 [Crassisporium funariophilum]|nr:hypothetical protein B0H34DRAFT_797120 [Crassisporium funariophilum]